MGVGATTTGSLGGALLPDCPAPDPNDSFEATGALVVSGATALTADLVAVPDPSDPLVDDPAPALDKLALRSIAEEIAASARDMAYDARFTGVSGVGDDRDFFRRMLVTSAICPRISGSACSIFGRGMLRRDGDKELFVLDAMVPGGERAPTRAAASAVGLANACSALALTSCFCPKGIMVKKKVATE